MKKTLLFIALSIPLYLCAFQVSAQQTGGVFGPVVNEGTKLWQYRAVYNAQTDGFAQRLHYDQSIDGDLMWRVIGQTKKTEDSDFDFDFFGAELFWELGGNNRGYLHGVRFDLKLRDDDRPQQLNVNWAHQFNLENDWSAKAVLLTSVQFGENSADGIGLQTRGTITKHLADGTVAGLEMFSTYGTTSDFADFEDQNHTIGPVVSFPVAKGWSVFVSTLFGITSAAPDSEIRLWLTRSI